jgi:cell wall-associated NlpC family hydrolase
MRILIHMSDDAIKDAAGKGAKEAKELAKDGAAIARAFAGDFSGMWRIIRRWGGRIIKLGAAIMMVMIQMWAASVTAQATCGVEPVNNALPEYDGGGTGTASSGTGGGGEDMSIVSRYYAELKRRYSADPDGNRVLLATFETALAESNFKNLDYGDRDSLGVFQQRPSSGWGSPSQIRDVDYALNKFLAKLEDRRKGSGASLKAHQLAQQVQISWCTKNNPPNNSDCHGTWGGNYLDEEQRARKLIEQQGGFFAGGGNEHGGNTLNATGTDTVVEAGAGACEGAYGNIDMVGAVANYKITDKLSGKEVVLDLLPGGQRGATIQASFTQMGVQYRLGANNWAETPGGGGELDCSALVLGAVKRGADITLYHQSATQYREMKTTQKQNPEAIKATQGDMLFFSTGDPGGIHHVGIYLGMGTLGGVRSPLMMHTANPEKDARIEPVWDFENVWSGDPGYKVVAADMDPAAMGTGELTSPLKPGSYSYSPKVNKFGGGHQGIDLIIKRGEPIYAVAAGTVIRSECNSASCNTYNDRTMKGCGYFVKIDHGAYTSSYCHMNESPLVKTSGPTKTVKKGQVIGYIGSTGHSGTPHLHFEIRKNGNTPIDPVPFLKSKGVIIK